MIPIDVSNRPFSSDLITGLMLPDGIFEATLGQQRINAQFKNIGGAAITNTQVYIESVSHPAIMVTPVTYFVSGLEGSATRLFSWTADFSDVPPGEYQISFMAKNGADSKRIIKKIFVTRVQFNPGTKTFSAQTPQGLIQLQLIDIAGPNIKDRPCCRTRGEKPSEPQTSDVNFLSYLRQFKGHDPEFTFCWPGYLLHDIRVIVTPTPPFPGQYGDLPFQDPWWKLLLLIIAFLLLVAAAIAEAVGGTGDITVSAGSGGGDGTTGDCCGVSASGGGTSYVAAGLTAAAAAVATAAALSDVRDPFRRGQDHTIPAPGELTTGESLNAVISYPEPVILGRPFATDVKWEYTRMTTGASYTFGVSETNTNIHVLSNYKITAPNVVRVYKREPFIVMGEFFDQNGNQLRGGDLFVQCFLIGPKGQWYTFTLQDDGIFPDNKPLDGVYTGLFQFAGLEPDPRGLWTYFVIAQDINTAQPNMKPEEAAQIIGGMVLTNQLAITFSGGTCPLVPDGDVNVV